MSQFATPDFDILSFDGGGSKGAMEVAIIQDVMNAVTLICQDPISLIVQLNIQDINDDNIDINLFKTQTSR
jgi:patatin-like phospholipase/acyl hydrolase